MYASSPSSTPPGARGSQVPSPVLVVDQLRTEFPGPTGPVSAVDGVSFSVDRGRILGLVGESGCGKSMTALSIMRLVPPPGRAAGGSVHVEGHGDIMGLSRSRMRALRGGDVSMIFQDPMSSLNPVMRVGEQMVEGLRYHRGLGRREAFERAVEMLHLVGIQNPQRRVLEYPHQMSGGMCQRVMIGMALCCEPKLILADEPTTALDVTIQAQILRLIHEVRERTGTAIVLITHDLGVIAETAEDVCVMYAGVIVERSSVRRLFAQPLHPYTSGLLRSVVASHDDAAIKSPLPAIRGSVPSLSELPGGCRFSDRCDHVMERCRVEAPVLTEVEPGHEVRCWLYPADQQPSPEVNGARETRRADVEA